MALGLIDRGSTSAKDIVDQLVLTPNLGHPYGPTEVIGKSVDMSNIIGALQDRDLVVEGELGFEIGPQGKTIRSSDLFGHK